MAVRQRVSPHLALTCRVVGKEPEVYCQVTRGKVRLRVGLILGHVEDTPVVDDSRYVESRASVVKDVVVVDREVSSVPYQSQPVITTGCTQYSQVLVQ